GYGTTSVMARVGKSAARAVDISEAPANATVDAMVIAATVTRLRRDNSSMRCPLLQATTTRPSQEHTHIMALRTVNPWLDHRHDVRPSGYRRGAYGSRCSQCDAGGWLAAPPK